VWEGVIWIHLAQKSDQWRAVVNSDVIHLYLVGSYFRRTNLLGWGGGCCRKKCWLQFLGK